MHKRKKKVSTLAAAAIEMGFLSWIGKKLKSPEH
jgi:hypothetical protein